MNLMKEMWQLKTLSYNHLEKDFASCKDYVKSYLVLDNLPFVCSFRDPQPLHTALQDVMTS